MANGLAEKPGSQRENARTSREHSPLRLRTGGGSVSELRTISSIKLNRTRPGRIDSEKPTFEWVNPRSLLIDPAYQRDISARSMTLIHKIIANWSWSRFKPPVVANTDVGLEIIDGQHTAIAAASHPEILTIPVMIVNASKQANRAASFLGHNKDRVPITRLQMHHAAVVAQDRGALTLSQLCELSDVRLLASQPRNGRYNPGETIAVGALEGLHRRQGDERTLKVLQTIRAAGCAPIGAATIRAVEMLLCDKEFAAEIDAEEIVKLLSNAKEGFQHEAKLFGATHRIPYWRALGCIIFQKRRRCPAGQHENKSESVGKVATLHRGNSHVSLG